MRAGSVRGFSFRSLRLRLVRESFSVIRKDRHMRPRLLSFLSLLAQLIALATASEAQAWGAAHASSASYGAGGYHYGSASAYHTAGGYSGGHASSYSSSGGYSSVSVGAHNTG